MDFAKAFDKVPHRRLLYKLNYYGVSRSTLHWISVFLTNRTQTLVIDGKSSSTVPVTSGVPQGTVLDPVLFLVYINDLSYYLTHSQLRLFADDNIIYMPIKSQHDCNKLQQDLNAAARWKSDWLMAFHPDKCSVLSVTIKKQPIQHNYILHNHILESVSSAKYLDITVQYNLKWDKHINDITSKGNKALGFLKRNLQTSNQQIKTQAYICNRYHNTSSVSDMFNVIHLPSLAERRLRTRLVMMYTVSFHLVAVPSDILIVSDTMTRKYHPLTYRQIHTSKDDIHSSHTQYHSETNSL